MSTNVRQTHAIMEAVALTWSIVILANVLRDMMVSTATTVRLRVEQLEVFRTLYNYQRIDHNVFRHRGGGRTREQ